MEVSLTVKNIVIVGEFQPSRFDKYYFLKNQIFEEGDILETSIFSSEFSVVRTNLFNLTVLNNQIILNENEPKDEDFISEIISKIVKTIEFKASGFGINLHWYIFSENDTNRLSKEYFYNENSVINQYFIDGNVSYGTYMSKDFGNSRMKLDIKPATVTKIETGQEQTIISFSFNFHTDLNTENFKVNIMKSLSEINEYTEETKKIVQLYAK